ncbi:transglycosylase domain-containing protein [Streptomyces acidiscabies]|uniref:Transglycosylase domain-containing protein n=1 Tax=Streptomyces acidiscabies TaxID=42234 RepID=A0AAP6BK02_9ACTN|nr:transglycosylase domain-containing protein [Streptomyces acidiscabies]MBP5937205.1 penicillin-binding protein [Streptomyces sp. LBUM 1476]MBZ3914741.1 penicillin-binding protein [Streptomyces acidiscabies]MDX2966106.1 transglycosylase domain-containing protein [Streptomyces acidiscabies]MDX3020655.1 transglycosylase domain-containing protein [Streptomyces acidiscabies]MDX3795862.1 transglycosylase domain-containing protein [Streptomyces acidiscabies]
MGRADDRRARQRGGRRAAPRERSEQVVTEEPPVGPSYEAPGASEPIPGGRAAARRAAQKHGKKKGKDATGPKGKDGRSFLRRMFTWKKILGTFLGVCLLGIGTFIAAYMLIDIPAGNADALKQSNVIRYSDGTVLARDGDLNRENVALSKIPKDVQRTFVAAENKTFYNDSGIDLKGTARGILNTVAGRGAQGGSTITQQYVKNYYLTQEQTVTRKLQEIVISLKLDRQKSKDYILAGYINTSYYGRGAYGIQAAAQAYYRVDADRLSVEQGAYLAALLQAPSQYDWAAATPTGKKLVQARWNYVLDNMVGQKWLDKTKRDAMKFPIPLEPKPAAGNKGQVGYLVDAAKKELSRQLVATGRAASRSDADALVDRGGWTITLNIDKKKQAALETSVKEQLTSKLDKKKRSVDGDVQAGAVSVDPKTGKVLAMYGGTDYLEHYINNATRTDYQPASTFKPVILAAALDRQAKTQDGDTINVNSMYDGTSKRPVVGSPIGFAPENEDDQDYGQVTVQTAMNKSINSVFAQLGVDVGMDKVMDTAKALGMDTGDLKAVPAQTLGTMGASPLQMAGVYATLDNHGKKVTPALIEEAESSTITIKPNPIGEQVVSRESADTVTSVLTGVVDDGTAKTSVRDNPNRNGQKVAGKTGTSDDNKSAWFTAYTPDLVTSVGLFGESAKPPHPQVTLTGATGLIPGKGRINGGGYPAQIWADYTFGVSSKVSKFDLETTQGAAVQPTITATPSPSPSPTPSPSKSPSPSPSPSKSSSPSPSPSNSPSPSPSPTPSNSPTPTPTGGDTLGTGGGNPFEPREGQ